MDNRKSEPRSGEIQEVLGRPPRSIVRWGTSIIFAVIVLLAGICWFIPYPETIVARAIIRKAESGRTCELVIPSAGAGKISRGQKVVVKLDNYPYIEYGYVSTTIDNTTMSLDMSAGTAAQYRFFISLPDTIPTNTGYGIDDSNDLAGSAEIVVRSTRLIYRIVDPIKAILQ